MNKIIDFYEYENKSSVGALSFETTGGGSWEIWDRYLTAWGKKAFHIGNVCGTCQFFFKRLEGAQDNVKPEEIVSKLQNGISSIDQSIIEKISTLLPNGKYYTLLLEANPRLVELGSGEDYFCKEQIEDWGIDSFWGLPFYPKVKYYRGLTNYISEHSLFAEFFVPFTPINWLENETISNYVDMINDGKKPTALAISVLDCKAACEADRAHYCFTHYVFDGHHKLLAAHKAQKSITILSFLALEQGVSSMNEIEKVLMHFKK